MNCGTGYTNVAGMYSRQACLWVIKNVVPAQGDCMVHVHGPCLGAHVDRRMLMVPIGPEICTVMGHDQCWLALGGSEHQILRPWKLQYQYVSSQYQCQGALGVATNQRPAAM